MNEIPDPTHHVARSARLWMRAYPRRWRTERGDELVALLTDLAAPDARRLDVRTAVDLVRSGWATRARTRPPLVHWLAYRFFGARIRPDYRAWARDDIDGRLFPLRRALVNYAVLAFFAVVDLVAPGPSLWGAFWWVMAAMAVVGTAVGAGPDRARAVERHLTLGPGEPVVTGAVVRSLGPRRRLAARSGLGWTTAALAVLAVTTTTSILLAPRGWTTVVEPIEAGLNVETLAVPIGSGRTVVLAALAASAAVGLLLAAAGALRARRALPGTARQPHRTTAPLARGPRVGITALIAASVLVAGHEITGSTVLWLSPVLGVLTLLVLPTTTALLVLARRPPQGHPGLAAVDLWRMALRGHPPTVDAPVLAPRRVSGPVPPGAVVPYPIHRDPPLPPLPPDAGPTAVAPPVS